MAEHLARSWAYLCKGFVKIHHQTVLPSSLWMRGALQGVIGIKVKIMLPYDPSGKTGAMKPLPDQVRHCGVQT